MYIKIIKLTMEPNNNIIDEIGNNNVVVEKRKKGRPRKNFNNINVNSNTTTASTTTNTDGSEQVKIKKKRGRKAALKYFSNSIRKQIPLTTNVVNNENDILYIDTRGITLDNNLKDESYHIDYHDDVSELAEIDFNDFIKGDGQEVDNNTVNFDVNHLIQENKNTIHIGEEYDVKDKLHKNVLEKDLELQKDNIKKGYYKLFNYFDGWEEKVNIKCWWCCHYFDTLPLGLPIKYDYKIQKFCVKGIFCSFACLLAHAKTTETYVKNKYLINFLYKKLTGITKILFKEDPPKNILKEFGGYLNIDEFRQLSNESKTYKMIEYPMFMSRDYIAEVDLVMIKQVNNKVFSNTNKMIMLDDKKVEDAKSRIMKTTQNNLSNLSNTIEDFINN